MYYVWESELRSWRGGVVRAELRLSGLDWPAVGHHLFSCEPFRHLLPERLEFDVTGARGGLRDHLWSANFEPCSPALIELVRETGAAYEVVPAVLWDRRSGALLSDAYQYLHVMNCLEATDWERSAVEVEPLRDGRPCARSIARLVLQEGVAAQRVPLFRLREARRLVLVHESFKAEYEARGLWGSSFVPIGEYSDGQWRSIPPKVESRE